MSDVVYRGSTLQQIAERLTAWFGRHIPGARAVRLEKLDVPTENGFSNETIMFELHYTEGSNAVARALVLRAAPDFFLMPSYDMQRQQRVQEALATTDVPVPRAPWYEPDASVIGGEFMVMERVRGRVPPLVPDYAQEGWVHALSPAEQAALWDEGLQVLARLQRLDVDRAGLAFLRTPELGATPVAQDLERWSRYVDWVMADSENQPSEVDAERCRRGLAWLRAHAPPGDEPFVLMHGDYKLSNLVFEGERCAGVLDWETVCLGSPLADLGWYVAVDDMCGVSQGIPRLPGFPPLQQTLARFEALTGRSAAAFDYWYMYALFRNAVYLARMGRRLAATGLGGEDGAAACSLRLFDAQLARRPSGPLAVR